MTEKTKTSTLATNYNALTLEKRASVIRYFKRQLKTKDIKAEIIKEAKRYFNPFIFGHDEIGGTNAMARERIISAITEAEAITLNPPGKRIEEEVINTSFEAYNTCEVELAQIITPVPNLSKYTDDIVHAEDLATALYEITSELRDKLISDSLGFLATQTTKKANKQGSKIRISAEAAQATYKQRTSPDLFDDLLPTLPQQIRQDFYSKNKTSELTNAKGVGFEFTPLQHDIITAIWELVADRSNTTNAKDIKTFYTGEASKTITALTSEGGDIELISPGVITTWAELTKRIYGSASQTDKDKVRQNAWDLFKNPEYHPILHYKINKYTIRGKKKETIERHVLTNDPIIRIEAIQDVNAETGDVVSPKGSIRIYINPIYAANIGDRYQNIPANFLESRRQIGQELNTSAPRFLNLFFHYINNAKTFRRKGETFEVGLHKNSKGEPGLYYVLGYESYKRRSHGKRFEKQFTSAIEYLKRFELITNYEEKKDVTGSPMGVFYF
jgi:hypothetical protein